jgi:glycosyltransferase involved in cell wall biosynthesis
MPQVSVVIPNYNHGIYLKQRIESILQQTYQDFELIILDDNSVDNSREIIESFRSSRKVSNIIYNAVNTGNPFKQWEKGISIAKGKYIWIAESDDWCESNLLEVLVSAFDINQDCALSYCQSYCIQETNLIKWQSQHKMLSEFLDGTQFIKDKMLTNNTIFNASMVLWKRALFPLIKKDFLDFKFCGDWLFWIELSKHGQVHISGKLLNYFRKHNKDISGNATKDGLNFIEGLKILNLVLQEKLITDAEHYTAIKKQYKNYWQQKRNLPIQISNEIETHFKRSLKTTWYYQIQLSARWADR